MTMDRLSELVTEIVPESKLCACRFLERLGLVFLIDFGYQNAEEIAHSLGWDGTCQCGPL